MMKRLKAIIIIAFYVFVFSPMALAFELSDNFRFNPQLYTRYDNTKLKIDYKDTKTNFYAAQFNAPLNLSFYENFSLTADLFFHYSKQAQSSLNFQTAALTYRGSKLLIKAGRQTYMPVNKESVIYYGPRYEINGAAPSALDGINSKAQLGLFFYDAIVAREALHPYNQDSSNKILGIRAGIGLMDFTSVEAFAFRGNGDIADTTIFGAAAGIYTDENFKISLDFAQSKRTEKQDFGLTGFTAAKKGYQAASFMQYVNQSARIKRVYKLRAILTNNNDNEGEGFTSISSSGYYGYIFSGQNVHNNSSARTDIAGYKIYNTAIEYSLNDLPPLSFVADLYLYESPKHLPLGDHRAYEVDLTLKYKAKNFELGAIYAFYGTNALAGNRGPDAIKNNTNKFGFYGKIFL